MKAALFNGMNFLKYIEAPMDKTIVHEGIIYRKAPSYVYGDPSRGGDIMIPMFVSTGEKAKKEKKEAGK